VPIAELESVFQPLVQLAGPDDDVFAVVMQVVGLAHRAVEQLGGVLQDVDEQHNLALALD